MIIRPANSRGIFDSGWIRSSRTFSNNSYWDPRYMSYGNLKVINDDLQQPDNMVPLHQHLNYDILGYMISGTLEHTDSLGNRQIAVPGQVQHMWCGSGIWHTEACISAIPARYIQIWITPKEEYKDTTPCYELIEKDMTSYGLIPVSLKQDMKIHAGQLNGDKTINIVRTAYVYVVSGEINGTDFTLKEGDGAELDSDLIANFDAHILLFEECV